MNKYQNYRELFLKWIEMNTKYKNIYNSMDIILFDTTLRDGLQNIPKENLSDFTTEKKIKLYEKIIKEYNPESIEIGSIVSEKFFPIFSDSLEILRITNQLNKNFLLVPSVSKLKQIINPDVINEKLYTLDVDKKLEIYRCKNFSFIASVSESFQIKNTKKTLAETRLEILKMTQLIDSNIKDRKIKLYLSCIDNCPIEGKISHDNIIEEIKYYHEICKPDIICLSDTCSSLSYESFINIIDQILIEGIDIMKISLHLHIDLSTKNSVDNLQKIFNSALDRKITKFDVSLLEFGGCVMTMNYNKTKPNLSYELYYKLLKNYIIMKYKE